MRSILLILVFLLALGMAACTDSYPPAPDDLKTESTDFRYITWQLESYQSSDGKVIKIYQNNRPTITFDDSRGASGYGGCNRFSAHYTADSLVMTITELVTTKIGCNDSMNLESIYLEGLRYASSYRATATSLHLYPSYPLAGPAMFGVQALNFIKVGYIPDPDPQLGEIFFNRYESIGDPFQIVSIVSKGGVPWTIDEQGALAATPRSGMLAYTSTSYVNFENTVAGSPDLVVSRTDGSDRKKIYPFDSTDLPVVDWTASISPEGDRVAFGVIDINLGASTGQELRTIDIDGGNMISITQKMMPETIASFSPDGTHLAFYTIAGDLYVAESFRANSARLVASNIGPFVDPSSFLGDYTSIDWSTDGTMLAFSGRGPNGSTDIYIVNSDGSNLRNITNDADDDMDPVWSPDGSGRIVFSSDRSIGQYKLHLLTLDNAGKLLQQKEPLTLSRSGNAAVYHELYPQWSRDGKQIVYSTFYQLPALDGTLEVLDLGSQAITTLQGSNVYRAFWSR